MEDGHGTETKDNDNSEAKRGAFNFKKNKHGIILSVHHTIKEGSNVIRIRLVTACFGDNNAHLVAIDHRGNIFVFNLSSRKFWKLSNKIPNSFIIRNLPGFNSNYVIGTKDGKLFQINIKNGEIENSRKFFDQRVENISFPGPSRIPNNFVTHSIQEACLVNINTFQATHKLEFNESKISLKFVAFLPGSDKIFACFTNDSVHIWSGITLSTTRIIRPIRIRDRYLKLQKVKELHLKVEPDNEIDEIWKTGIKDYTKGLLNSFSFSPDGRFICLTTIDDFIVIISPDSYDVITVIKLKDIACKSTCILPQCSGFMLFAITAALNVVLIDGNEFLAKIIVQEGKAYKANISDNGRLLCVILNSGEMNLYDTRILINSMKTVQMGVQVIKESKGFPMIAAGMLDKELKAILTKERLIPILREYGEYPGKYRHLIWNALLNLPCNKNSFLELMKKGLHPATTDYDKLYPLKDISSLRNLKKIMSCLIHWCSMFGHSECLPGFVFPFLKIFPHSPLLSFELIASVLFNYCQLWFEFAPLEPFNYLGLVENVLRQFDQDLFKFYTNNNITAKIYAWPLMISAFSEVCDEHQWYQLWDSILSNQPYYLVFCIVAYNVVQRNVIMNLKLTESIQQFFHEQNVVDVLRVTRRAISFMERCPQSIHPKRYMKKYVALNKGFYPKFENYPEKWVEMKEDEMKTLRMERELLDEKIRELEKAELTLAKRLEDGLKQEEHEKRMKEVEKLYGEAISREEERVSCQRKMLLLYQKQIRDRKAKVLELVRESAHRRNVNARENELDTLMRTIEHGRLRNEGEMVFADEDIKIREMNLLAQKYEIEAALLDNEPLTMKFKDALHKLGNQKKQLNEELGNLKMGNTQGEITTEDFLSDKISSIENVLQKIEILYTKATATEGNKNHKAKLLKELVHKTNCLEPEVNLLLRNLNVIKL